MKIVVSNQQITLMSQRSNPEIEIGTKITQGRSMIIKDSDNLSFHQSEIILGMCCQSFGGRYQD